MRPRSGGPLVATSPENPTIARLPLLCGGARPPRFMWISQAPRKAPTTSPATRQWRRGFAAASGGLARVLAEGRKPAQIAGPEGRKIGENLDP